MNRERPEFSTKDKVLGVFILILLSPIIFLIILYVVGKMFMVYAPALLKVQTVPRYWLTWKEIKLLTGLSTSNTLNFLTLFTDNTFFECRLREDAQVERIKKLRRRKKIPATDKPLFKEDVIYYEFRMIWKGGRKRPSLKTAFGRLVGGLQPKPVLAVG